MVLLNVSAFQQVFHVQSINSIQVKIEKKCNSYRIVSTLGSKVRDVTFPLGQEVDTVNLINQPVKVTVVGGGDRGTQI